jgi:hypothetical protein
MRHEARARLHWTDRIIGYRLDSDGFYQPVYRVSGGATGVAASNYLEQKLLEHTLRAVAYSAPADVFAALYTVTPDDTGGGTEVTGGSYARQDITFGAYASGAVTNSVLVDFGTASANWGTVVACGVFDASTAGNLLFYGALLSNKTVDSGDGFSFAIGKLTVGLD